MKIDLDTRLRIGGKPSTPNGDRDFAVLDPSTGEALTSVSSASVDDAMSALLSAETAAADWAHAAPRSRSIVLRRAFELMTERAEYFAALIVAEMGKSLSEARAEVTYAAEFFRWYSEEAVRNIGSVGMAPQGDKRIMAIDQPAGVALLITPWNFPAAMATRKIAPAAAAGCTMILKPASDTPLTALAIADLMGDAGLPDGVLNVIPSRESGAIARSLLGSGRVRVLSFTGSTEVGRTLLAAAAPRIVTASMELGGNAPFVVFEDADVEEAAAGAVVAKLRNVGQSCIAANRFYVQAGIAKEFVDALSEEMAKVRVGAGMDPDVDLGPVISRSAQESLEGSVAALTRSGGRLVLGGSAPQGRGFFFPPTVVSDVSAGDPVLGAELFGPVAPVVTFATEDEALAYANMSEQGLAAYVYSRDLSRALRFAEALESGMVGINRGVISDPAAPFGGVKESGLGREGSSDGMHEFLERKYIAVGW